jgi:hypothetical protein
MPMINGWKIKAGESMNLMAGQVRGKIDLNIFAAG